MIILTASKSCLTASRRELLVEGAVNVNIIQFVFSSDWDGPDQNRSIPGWE